MLTFDTASKWLSVLAASLLISNAADAQPWTYDFGTATGTHPINSASTSFLTGLPSGGGTYRVRTGTGGGTIVLANPGTSLGSGSELQINSSSSTSTNKFGVYDWSSPSTVAYVKYKVRTTSSANGNLNFTFGANTLASDNNGYTNQYNISLTSLTITYNSGAISSVVRRNSGSNSTITGSGLAKDTDQAIEIYASNSAGTEVYHRGGTDYTLDPQSWDLWVDGNKISPAQGWPKAGTWASGNNISGFGFFAESSTGNAAVFYIDDLEYSNAFPVGSSNTSVQFVSTGSTVSEAAGTSNLALAITNPSTTSATTVTINATGATGRITGYSTTVTFPANTSANQNCVVSLNDDALCNGTGNVTFTITGISGGQGTPAIGTNIAHVLSVTDNETAVDPTATAATGIGYGGFTANWNAVSGATGYFLDVSTSSTFAAPPASMLVKWDFPSASADNVADGGIAANTSRTISTNSTGTISYVAGSLGAPDQAISNTGWDSGSGSKAWQVDFTSLGYFGLSISSKQQSSNTGPADFKVQYRIGTGGTWTDVTGGAITVANNFTSGVVSNLSLPAACDNQAQVFLRWIMTSNTAVNGGTVAGAGTSRIDDIVVNAANSPSYVAGYENLSVGNVTSYGVTGLNPLTTYHYRVRSAGGCSTGANSNTISASTTAVPTYYSRATGGVNDPIWSDTPSGSAGAATWSSASDMVIQSGDAVTINANTTIKSLTVESGGALAIDANRFLKATAGTNTIQGTLNAADNSRLEISEGTSATLAISGTASFWDFTAGMTTGVTVTGNMDIRGTLQVDDGDLDATGANVTLRSTASYTGRLGPIGTGASYSGNLKIERHIPAGATNWRLLGSPLENQQVVHWQDDFITAGYPGSQYPNFPGGAQPNWPSIRWYDETNTGASDNDGLQGVTNQLQALTPGQGFATWCGDNLVSTNAFTIDLGPEAPVVGPVTLPMSFTDSGNPTADGWNLVANPLPSPVDFSSISRGANVEDYVTFYNPANGNTAVFDLGLNFGTNGATSTIQSMQGFFLKATGSAVTTVIDESDKVAGNGGGMFGGSFGSVPPALRLQLSTSANAWKDEAGIVFHAGAPGHDAQDVLKYSLSANGAPRISTLAGSQPVAINAFGSLSSDMAIPVMVQAGTNGTHTITVSAQGEFGISCITLEDLVTGTVTAMTDGASYSFNLTTSADPSTPRFMIRASAPALLYAEDATCGGMPNGQASIVAQGGPHDITWMNLAGETLLVQNGIANGVATITGLGAGSYTVSVTTVGCGTITREFAIDAPFVLEATAAVTNATCADANDGRIDLLPLGGTAPYAYLWNDAAASTTEDLTAAPGTYSVTITDANGCTWTSSGLTIANGGPVAEMTAAPATALVNEPVQFLAADADGSYFWSFGDGNSSTAQDPVHTYTFPGTYTVVLSVDNGLCADAVTADITVELSTGAAEAAVRAHRAWATPQGIVVEHAFGGKAAVQVELLDATGRLAFARRATAERMVLPADGLASGLWFVRLTSGDSRHTLRVPLTR